MLMLVSMKSVHQYLPQIGFPIRDLDSLQRFARDFVIGLFEIRPVFRIDADITKGFEQRMQRESTDTIIQWIHGWPSDQDLDVAVNLITERIFLGIHHRRKDIIPLIEQLPGHVLKIIDSALDRYLERSLDISDNLDTIQAELKDNWDYTVHYIFNRTSDYRDGKRDYAPVVMDMSPLTWLELMLDTVDSCALLRELKPVFTPDIVNFINEWLEQQNFWKTEYKATYRDFMVWFDYIDAKGPEPRA
jgi:hypothetical protein